MGMEWVSGPGRHCFYFPFLKLYFIFFCLAALGLHCCAWTFSRCSEQGLLPRGAVWAAHCSGFSFCGAWALGARGQEVQPVSSVAAVCRLLSTGSVVAARGRRCPRAWRSLPDQGSNPCPLHWQVDYHWLDRQRDPQEGTSVQASKWAVHAVPTHPLGSAAQACISPRSLSDFLPRFPTLGLKREGWGFLDLSAGSTALSSVCVCVCVCVEWGLLAWETKLVFGSNPCRLQGAPFLLVGVATPPRMSYKLPGIQFESKPLPLGGVSLAARLNQWPQRAW